MLNLTWVREFVYSSELIKNPNGEGLKKKKEKEKEIKSYYYGLLGLLMNYSHFTPSK